MVKEVDYFLGLRGDGIDDVGGQGLGVHAEGNLRNGVVGEDMK